MNKKAYKELQKKLKDKFTKPRGEYAIPTVVGTWMAQCNIKPTATHLNIICKIFGGVPYPHQPLDRKVVLKYLKKNKYKKFKNG